MQIPAQAIRLGLGGPFVGGFPEGVDSPDVVDAGGVGVLPGDKLKN